MKFALLGADAESRALADAASAAGHVLSWREPDSKGANPGAWEDLFDPATADAVIVGSASDADAELRARRVLELARLGRPMLVVHPVVPSVISHFEIDLARTDGGAVLQHYNPLVEPACVAQLAAWVRDGHPQLGAVEQISATRRQGERSRQRVLWHFARDVELLGRLAGRFDRIGAHGAAGDPDAAYASLSVQLSGPHPIPVRWSVEPLAGRPDLRVSLIAERGRVTLVFDAEGRAVELAEQGDHGESTQPLSDESPASAALQQFAAAVATSDGAPSTWPAALAAMELADSIEISLRRGRMIDVYQRELTEQLAFKGVMSALGCGVLVVVIPLMLAVGWIAGIVKVPLSEYWPHLLLLVLAAFLAVQVLPTLLLAKSAPTDAKSSDGAAVGEVKSPSQSDPAD